MVMDTDYTIQIYSTESGKEPFKEWLDSLRNNDTRALILQRLQRIRLGNLGDCKPLEEGLREFRIHTNAGYRIYFTRTGKRIVLLFCGGDKGSQPRDIKQALRYLEDYRRRTQ
jgi:putative addiction module killer protein